MTQKMLRVPLADLLAIRLRCPSCASTTESPIRAIPAKVREAFKCPCCGMAYSQDGTNHPVKLSDAVAGLESCKEGMVAELLIADNMPA